MTLKERMAKRMAIAIFSKFIKNVCKVESNVRSGKAGRMDLFVMRSHLLTLTKAYEAEKKEEDKKDVMQAVMLALDACELLEQKKFDQPLLDDLARLKEWYKKNIESFKEE